MLHMPHEGYETAGSDGFRTEPARLDGGFATRHRVRALLDAVLAIGSDLDLEAAPRQIVEAATALVDARYGSLGVIGEDREHLSEFITVGATEAGSDEPPPPGKSFIGVPIRVCGSVFGNLYLTEKAGGGEFTKDDETVVLALATAAGVAIENARLYQDTRRRECW